MCCLRQQKQTTTKVMYSNLSLCCLTSRMPRLTLDGKREKMYV